jgi:6-phosphogluconolactonase
MALQLKMFKNAHEAAQALALAVSEDLQQVLAAAPATARALLLVSGGRSPLPFFAALAQQQLQWSQIDISLVDERSVPPTHPDSNAALVCEHLLQGAAHAATFLPLMESALDESDPWRWAEQSAAAANARQALAQPAAIVLGLGTDGHTASLFADAPQWQEAITTTERYVAIAPGQAPHARVSLSLQALIAQRSCYVWSNGAAKLEVIKQAQGTAAAVAEGLIDGAALHGAGPFALLLAHPEVRLQVFHSEE